jgi:Zn-dependent protease with chaperone function
MVLPSTAAYALRRRVDDRDGKLADLLRTHPPSDRRIILLSQMAGLTDLMMALIS